MLTKQHIAFAASGAISTSNRCGTFSIVLTQISKTDLDKLSLDSTDIGKNVFGKISEISNIISNFKGTKKSLNMTMQVESSHQIKMYGDFVFSDLTSAISDTDNVGIAEIIGEGFSPDNNVSFDSYHILCQANNLLDNNSKDVSKHIVFNKITGTIVSLHDSRQSVDNELYGQVYVHFSYDLPHYDQLIPDVDTTNKFNEIRIHPTPDDLSGVPFGYHYETPTSYQNYGGGCTNNVSFGYVANRDIDDKFDAFCIVIDESLVKEATVYSRL